MTIDIRNTDCITGAVNFDEKSVDLMICDPPFGINESSFEKHYNRDNDNVIEGYVEAPKEYGKWTVDWVAQATRLLKDAGSMYIVSGWSNLREVLNAIHENDLKTINHLIWKFNFACYTQRKYTSSHYHILYVAKYPDKVTFNTACRFGAQEVDEEGEKLQYQDLSSVWDIQKQYCPGEVKNENKLPDELVTKMILYSSNKGDIVCDFFMGNFTTAYMAAGLGRGVIGFELNKAAYDYHMGQLQNYKEGCLLDKLKPVINKKPKNQGKPITPEERANICKEYDELFKDRNHTKKEIKACLCKQYGRGPFSITNIIKKHEESKRKSGKQDDECEPAKALPMLTKKKKPTRRKAALKAWKTRRARSKAC